MSFSTPCYAGIFEISGGGSYTHSTYDTEDSFNWRRTWGLQVAYHFTERSGIELGFEDVYDVTNIQGFESVTTHDQIYSIDWIQGFTDRNSAIQPYVKAGAGQLNRTASGNFLGGISPPTEVDSVTVILGVGLRLFITKGFAIKGEALSYLADGNINTWQDNISVNAGISFFF